MNINQVAWSDPAKTADDGKTFLISGHRENEVKKVE
jgi:hypothetical protein